jgi:hypothetical protein
MKTLRHSLERFTHVFANPTPGAAARSSQSTPPIWILPEDIILHILDYLAEDTSSLKALCLTSMSFMAPCQRLLFAKLILRSSSVTAARSTLGKELLQLFERRPAIPHYIKRIEIHDRGRNLNPQWLLDDEDLDHAMSLLDPNRIEHLALRRGPSRAEDPLHTHFSGTLLGILRSICRSDSLKTLSLAWINRPDVFAICGRSLHHLHIAEGMCTTFQAEQEPPPLHPVQINSLSILFPSYYGSLSETTRCLLATSMWVDLERLTRLSIATRDYSDTSHLLLLLSKCASSLEELYMSTPPHIHRHKQRACL